MLNCFGAIGFISLSLEVQPIVYVRHSGPGALECDGGEACFRDFHLICLGYSVVGGVAAVGLIWVVAKQRSRQRRLLPAVPGTSEL